MKNKLGWQRSHNENPENPIKLRLTRNFALRANGESEHGARSVARALGGQ
jgi:hypothetical protein